MRKAGQFRVVREDRRVTPGQRRLLDRRRALDRRAEDGDPVPETHRTTAKQGSVDRRKGDRRAGAERRVADRRAGARVVFIGDATDEPY